MSTSEPLFRPSLISADVAASFPPSFSVRPLSKDDYGKGFLDCLRALSHVGDIAAEQFGERFDWMKTQGQGIHYHIVVEHEDRIVGTGALIVERKFIHDLGTVGHVEEVAIRPEYQGKGLGLALMNSLSSIAKNVGCYRSTLGCSENNEPFYMKCGYEKRGRVMSQYYEEMKPPYMRG